MPTNRPILHYFSCGETPLLDADGDVAESPAHNCVSETAPAAAFLSV